MDGFSHRKKDTSEIMCLCNGITRNQIEEAIKNGANTLNKIFDSTTAGVGSCGGSCRKKLGPLLEYYLKNGKFPENQNSPKVKAKK